MSVPLTALGQLGWVVFLTGRPRRTEEVRDDAGVADDEPRCPADPRLGAVSTARWHSCALRSDAAIVCWGDNEDGQTDAPAGAYIAVAAGRSHSCALRRDHTATCWGATATDLHGDTDL